MPRKRERKPDRATKGMEILLYDAAYYDRDRIDGSLIYPNDSQLKLIHRGLVRRGWMTEDRWLTPAGIRERDRVGREIRDDWVVWARKFETAKVDAAIR